MSPKTDEFDRQGSATKLSECIASVFEQKCKTEFIGTPEIVEKDLIEYNSHMRVFGLEKFNGPCYISAINLFKNDEDLKKNRSIGAVILYIEETTASDLIKAMGQKGVDHEDIDTITSYTGEFCKTIVDQFKNNLNSLGYNNIISSEPFNYQDDIPGGVNFSFKESKFSELSFVVNKEPAIKVDLTIAPIT